MARVFGKTDQGAEEIAHRTLRLAPRLRSLLILVDGKKSDEALAAMLPGAAEGLAQLLEQGFVRLLAETVVAAPPAPAPAAAPAAPSAAQIARDAAHAITDLLGIEGDTLALRIERAKTTDDLQLALRAALRTLRLALRPEQAEAFRQRFLPGDPT